MSSSNGSNPRKQLEPCSKHKDCNLYDGHKGDCRDKQGRKL